jgi:hypothetical protein
MHLPQRAWQLTRCGAGAAHTDPATLRAADTGSEGREEGSAPAASLTKNISPIASRARAALSAAASLGQATTQNSNNT